MSEEQVTAVAVESVAVEAAPAMGTKELTEIANAAIDVANMSLMIAKDGKLDFTDLAILIAAMPQLAASVPLAIADAQKVGAELKDLTVEESAAFAAHVMTKLQVAEGKAKLIVAASLKAAVANYQLIKEILA